MKYQVDIVTHTMIHSAVANLSAKQRAWLLVRITVRELGEALGGMLIGMLIWNLFNQSKIHSAPGSSWMKLTEFFYSKKFVEGTITPTIADWQCEYFEALEAGRKWKARWINARYNWAMIKTLWLGKVWELVEKVFGLVKSKG